MISVVKLGQDAPESKSFCAQTQKDDEVSVPLWGTVAVHHHLSIVGGQEESSALRKVLFPAFHHSPF